MAKKKKKVNIDIVNEPVAKVPLGKMKNMIKSIERDFSGSPEIIDNMDITFEYIIASLFPNIMDNIKKEFRNQYLSGYNDRLKIGKFEDKKVILYAVDDLERAMANLNVAMRLDWVSDNDKRLLKDLHETIGELITNIGPIKE